MPATIKGQRGPHYAPEDTTPQPNAHIGGNQVIGFNNSSTTDGAGRRITFVGIKSLVVIGPLLGSMFRKAETAQLDVKALATETEHLGSRRTVVACQFQRRLDG